MLGAGGAASALADAMIDAGAAELRLANRTTARAEAIVERLGPRARAIDAWPVPDSFFDDADLIINATTYGMKDDLSGVKPWPAPKLPDHVIAADLIYAPLDTIFLKEMRALGATTVDGLGMLLHQARPSFEAWFGVAVEADSGLRAEVMRRLNE